MYCITEVKTLTFCSFQIYKYKICIGFIKENYYLQPFIFRVYKIGIISNYVPRLNNSQKCITNSI